MGHRRVSHLLSAYCELISSSAQLARCQAANSIVELLAIIKDMWQQTKLSDEQLITELVKLNQQPLDSNKIQLAGQWLPYRYHAKSRSIFWCLPDGHATEPFQDETISRYRKTVLVNQFITPKTTLSAVSIQAQAVQSITPSAFIFHLSRCGSTLISGCLSELDTTSVLSESPLLTEVLLDHTLGEIAQLHYLQQLINLQASVFPSRPQVVIKWNAWDIFRWRLIRDLYPQVPVIFLVRNPVEILASHQRLAGRHMGGDPALAGFHPVFAACTFGNLLDKRIQILLELMRTMIEKFSIQITRVVCYQQLCAGKIVSILTFLGMPLEKHVFLKIQQRMQFHSKTPGQVFVADSVQKQQCFTVQERTSIDRELLSAYNELLQLSYKTAGKDCNAC